MSVDAPRKLGIIGTGVAGGSMHRAVLRSDRFVLSGIAESSPELRDRMARDWSCPAFSDAAELVGSGAVDVVYVATPTVHHVAGIAAAADAGVHVICEKPLATTITAARTAVEHARRAGVTLLVGPTLSFDPRYLALREIVAERQLGDLLSVRATSSTDWHRRRPRTAHDLDASTGNGLLLRQGAHLIDIVRLVCGGEVTSVFGTLHGGAGGSERGFTAQLTFSNGAQANAYYDGSGMVVGEDELLATFTHGGVRVHASTLEILADDRSDRISVPPPLSVWDRALVEMDEALGGATPIHDGQWAVGTLATCLALYAAAESHTVVPMNSSI